MRKGQFISNRLDGMYPSVQFPNRLVNIANYDLDKLLKEYRDYLINSGICPICYNDLNVADRMIEVPHCHKCKWDTDSLNYTK